MERRMSKRVRTKPVRTYDESSSDESQAPSNTQKRRRRALDLNASTDSNLSYRDDAHLHGPADAERSSRGDTRTSARRVSARGTIATRQDDSDEHELSVDGPSNSFMPSRSLNRDSLAGRDSVSRSRNAASVESNDEATVEASVDLSGLDAESFSKPSWPARYELALVRYIARDKDMRDWAKGDIRGGTMIQGLRRFSKLIDGPDPNSLYQRVCRWRAKHKLIVPRLTYSGKTTPTSSWTNAEDLKLLENHGNPLPSTWLTMWHDCIFLEGTVDASASSRASSSSVRQPRKASTQDKGSKRSSVAGPSVDAQAVGPSDRLSLAARAAMLGMVAPPSAAAASPLQAARQGGPVVPRSSMPSLLPVNPSGPTYQLQTPYASTQTQLESHTQEIAQLKTESKQLRLSLAQQTNICMRQSQQLERQNEKLESQASQIAEQAQSLREMKHQVDFLYALVRERTGASPDNA